MYVLPFPGIQNVAAWVRICCRVNGTLPRPLCGWSSLEGPNPLEVSSLALHVLTLRVPGNLRLAILFYDVPLGKWARVHNNCTAQTNPNRVCQPCGGGC